MRQIEAEREAKLLRLLTRQWQNWQSPGPHTFMPGFLSDPLSQVFRPRRTERGPPGFFSQTCATPNALCVMTAVVFRPGALPARILELPGWCSPMDPIVTASSKHPTMQTLTEGGPVALPCSFPCPLPCFVSDRISTLWTVLKFAPGAHGTAWCFYADHQTDGVDGVGVVVPLTVQMDREDWLAQPLPPRGFCF